MHGFKTDRLWRVPPYSCALVAPEGGRASLMAGLKGVTELLHWGPFEIKHEGESPRVNGLSPRLWEERLKACSQTGGPPFACYYGSLSSYSTTGQVPEPWLDYLVSGGLNLVLSRDMIRPSQFRGALLGVKLACARIAFCKNCNVGVSQEQSPG